jgi:ketosteroid isomerase-like protein
MLSYYLEEDMMKADDATEKAVKFVLEKFAESYAKRDLNSAMSLIAPDADVVMYGTGADEKRIGPKEIKAQFERDLSQIEDPALEYKWTSISASGNVAWIAIDAVFKAKVDGKNMRFPSRITEVLEKRGDTWLIVQGHFSFPDQSQFFD